MNVLFSLGFMLAAVSSLAADGAPAVLAKYRDAVLRVRVLVPARGLATAGTGFFTSPDGEFVTNHHVFKMALQYRDAIVQLELGNGRVLKKYEIGKCDGENGIDVCLLRLSDYEARVWFRPGWDYPREGSRVYLIGSPGGGPLKAAGGRFVGSRMYDDASEVQVTIPFEKGMSGGPIFTEDGVLVGMTTRWISEWLGAEPRERYSSLETSLGISTRELQRFRKKVKEFKSPASYFRSRADGS